jgi:hypothetical protein
MKWTQALVGLLILTSGCDQPATTPEPEPLGTPGIDILTTVAIADTIGMEHTVGFQVHTTQGGIFAGATVEVVADPSTNALLLTAGTSGYATRILLLTDSLGRGSFRILLGEPTNASVRLSVPALDEDTLSVIVAPGRPASITVLPRDTILMLGGGTARLRVAVKDRWGNQGLQVDSSLIQVAALTPQVTVTPGRTISATAFGTGRVEASFGSLRDQTDVRIVPRAKLVGFTSDQLLEVNMDGTQSRVLHTAGGGIHFAHADPSSERVVFEASELVSGGITSTTTRIIVLKPDGTRRTVFEDELALDVAPRWSADGQWIIYNRQNVFRVRPDSSREELIGGVIDSMEQQLSASLAPNGRTLAYVLARIPYPEGPVMTRDIITGETRTMSESGVAPVWSPDGSMLGWLMSNQIHIADADGSNRRPVAARGVRFSWSGDSLYLIAEDDGVPTIVRISDGVSVPLKLGLQSVSWRD